MDLNSIVDWLLAESIQCLILCSGDESLSNGIVQSVSRSKALGLDLYHQNAADESDLAIIGKRLTADSIGRMAEGWLQDALMLSSLVSLSLSQIARYPQLNRQTNPKIGREGDTISEH